MTPIVIIGTGIAGYSVAREFRKHDKHRPLILLTEDEGSSYYKPVLSNALTSGKTPEAIPLADAGTMSGQLNAEVRPFTTVLRCDPKEQVIEVDGKALAFEKLVLAMGADPIHVPIGGDGQDRLFSVNNLIDYRRFREAISGARTVAVMGAGLIGCEFANDLHAAKIKAHLVDPAPYPLNRFVPESIGRALQAKLASLGVEWSLGTVVQSVESYDNRLRIHLSNQRSFTADAVLSAIGLRPRVKLAADCGLAVNHGILVDQYLRTSDGNIFALGDCAEVEGLVLPFVMPISHAARALAKTLSGQATRVNYPPMPVVVKTTDYPIVVAPPKSGVQGNWDIQSQDDGITALFYDDSQALQGFALSGSAVAQKNALAKALPPVLSA